MSPTLDESVLKFLPPGVEVLSLTQFGQSCWQALAQQIVIRQANGDLKSLFLKSSANRNFALKEIFHGTFESEVVLHEYAPRNVPKPLGWGAYVDEPSRYFFLAEYHEMKPQNDIQKLCQVLASIHQESKNKSPGGKWGYHMKTPIGPALKPSLLCDTWIEYFTSVFTDLVRDKRTQHTTENADHREFARLAAIIIERVIPRLLLPLETGGNKIEPVLLHGDLWPGNVGTDVNTGEIMIYDSGVFWGHNEIELGLFRPTKLRPAPQNRFGLEYMEQYFKHFPRSEPVEDWELRNLLYALKDEMLCAILNPTQHEYTEQAMKSMITLIGLCSFGDLVEDGHIKDSAIAQERRLKLSEGIAELEAQKKML